MMSHLTGNSSLALVIPRAEASINERSPSGLGVINAQVNCAAASVAGAWVAAGAAPQAVRTIDATIKALNVISKRFFISFSFSLNGFRQNGQDGSIYGANTSLIKRILA